MANIKDKIKLVRNYFRQKPEVLMSFIFGSYAAGRETSGSDFDIAVYFRDSEKTDYSNEDQIRLEVTEILHQDIDLVCLNGAPASLVSDVIKTGIPLFIRDRKLYWTLYLKVSLEAEDFLGFARDYMKIYQNAKSLVPEQKTRLLARLQFLEDEFREIGEFEKLTFKEYQDDKIQRRNIERWTENIINASIDIAKIILASEKKKMPGSYEEALRDFAMSAGLADDEARKFAAFAGIRNILAHEYLEILYGRIQNFIKESPLLYKKILHFLDNYL